jgi:hypothetical protein
MRWVLWDGFGGVQPSAPRLSASAVLIYVAQRYSTAKLWEDQHGKGTA